MTTTNCFKLTFPRLIITMLIILSVNMLMVKCTNLKTDSFENEISNNPVRIQRDLSDVWSNLKNTMKSIISLIPESTLDIFGKELKVECSQESEKEMKSIGREITNALKKQIKEVEQAYVEQITNKQSNSMYEEKRKAFVNDLNSHVSGAKFCWFENKPGNFTELEKTKNRQYWPIYYATDACCKKHDLCPKIIQPGEVKFGLNNTSLFAKATCTCDLEFYNCIKAADYAIYHKTVLINRVGFTYFNLLSPDCFEEYVTVNACDTSKDQSCPKTRSEIYEVKYRFVNNPEF